MQDCELPSQIDRQCLEGPMGAASPGSTHETAYRSPDWSADPRQLDMAAFHTVPMMVTQCSSVRDTSGPGVGVPAYQGPEPMMESRFGGGLERMAGSIAAASASAPSCAAAAVSAPPLRSCGALPSGDRRLSGRYRRSQRHSRLGSAAVRSRPAGGLATACPLRSQCRGVHTCPKSALRCRENEQGVLR